tara:strand:+ start:2508 stop:3143 length:636 start_codon:yes stop_codon:yes gene_type:complete
MLFRSLIRIIKSYRFSLTKIIFFELLYLIKGFKGNRFTFSKNEMADNIPCPYYFLHKIKNFFANKNIKSFIDLGSGYGRVIYFFNKYFKINYCGIEYFDKPFNYSKSLFEKDKNIHIKNENFKNLNFLNDEYDCYFLNEPLKNKKDFELVMNNIIKKYSNTDKKYYIILINMTKEDLEIFSILNLVDSEIIHTNEEKIPWRHNRGYYIYSN